MKALVRNENGEIRIADIPEPYVLKEDEVKIRVLYSSFCRDDMRYEDKTDVFSHIGVVGHEVVGVIEDLGPYAQYAGFALEDKVLVLPWESCGKCENCLAQRTQCCTEAHVVMGTMTKHMIRTSRQLVKLDPDIAFKQAVLMEPVGGVIEGISKLPIDYDKEVLIIGAGFTGLVFVKLLKMRGVKNITVIEPIAARRTQAISYGADYAVNPDAENFQWELSTCCQYDGFDIVIETSSSIRMLESAVSFLTRGGTLEIFTYYGSLETISFSALDMYASNITVIWTSFCSMGSIKTAERVIKRESLEELITAEYDFNHVLQAFEKYKTYEHIKIGIKNF